MRFCHADYLGQVYFSVYQDNPISLKNSLSLSIHLTDEEGWRTLARV